MMAYQYNYYLNHKDDGYLVCINPKWESELDLIKNTLELAKKEHELLRLYRGHMNTLCKKAREGVKDSMFSAERVAYKLYQQIQALEEELK